MNILPTSCDANGFLRIDSRNRGWELRVEVQGRTMEDLLSQTVLQGMIQEVPVSPDFSWLSDKVKKHYIIDGSLQLDRIKRRLEEQAEYDSNEEEALEGDTSESSSYKLKLYEISKGPFAGTIAFYVTNKCDLQGKAIIRGYQIDLNTYLRVPRYFGETHKFLPIALFSPTQVGKSTLLASLFAKGLVDLPNEYEHELDHWEHEGDYVCDWYMRQAEDMKKGKCPALTQATYKVPPVFINLAIPDPDEESNDIGLAENITVGIYDFSGELLDNSGAGYDIVQMLPFMKGIIYLTGPEIVPGFNEIKHTDREDTIRKETPVRILTLAEQADYQKTMKINGNRPVRGLDVVDSIEVSVTGTGRSTPEAFYDRVIRYFGKTLHDIHLAFVIAQSDRLEGQACLSDMVGIERLFIHDSEQRDLYQSDNSSDFRNFRKLEEKIIKEKILTTRERNLFETRHRKHVSYHMVSATGCECEQNAERGSFDPNQYDPIRVAEPFLVCIREMLKNGMYYED